MVKIAISLPEAMLQAIEVERQASGETRSEFFRRAVEELLCRKKWWNAEDVERYIRGYQQFPETKEDPGELDELAFEALTQEPWEEE